MPLESKLTRGHNRRLIINDLRLEEITPENRKCSFVILTLLYKKSKCYEEDY